jgi:hypothetical protein
MITTITCVLVLAGFGASVSGYMQQKKAIELTRNRRNARKREFEDFLMAVEKKTAKIR